MSVELLFCRQAPDLPASAKETLPRRRTHIGTSAFGAPNQVLESSFCCWTAGQGLAQKECCFHRYWYESPIWRQYCNILKFPPLCSSGADGTLQHMLKTHTSTAHVYEPRTPDNIDIMTALLRPSLPARPRTKIKLIVASGGGD